MTYVERVVRYRQRLLRAYLDEAGGVMVDAARLAGMNRTHFYEALHAQGAFVQRARRRKDSPFYARTATYARRLLKVYMHKARNVIVRAAQLAGVHRSTFYRSLVAYGVVLPIRKGTRYENVFSPLTGTVLRVKRARGASQFLHPDSTNDEHRRLIAHRAAARRLRYLHRKGRSKSEVGGLDQG